MKKVTTQLKHTFYVNYKGERMNVDHQLHAQKTITKHQANKHLWSQFVPLKKVSK